MKSRQPSETQQRRRRFGQAGCASRCFLLPLLLLRTPRDGSSSQGWGDSFLRGEARTHARIPVFDLALPLFLVVARPHGLADPLSALGARARLVAAAPDRHDG